MTHESHELQDDHAPPEVTVVSVRFLFIIILFCLLKDEKHSVVLLTYCIVNNIFFFFFFLAECESQSRMPLGVCTLGFTILFTKVKHEKVRSNSSLYHRTSHE